jgi:hypothetical protein
MNEIKNLDEVLKFLHVMGFANISEYKLEKELKSKGLDFSDKFFVGGDNSMSRLDLILEKLFEDKYITRWKTKTNRNGTDEVDNRVSIKYNGILFSKKGGYEGEIIEREKKDGKEIRRTKSLIWATWSAGFAGTGLIIIEILKQFVWSHSG